MTQGALPFHDHRWEIKARYGWHGGRFWAHGAYGIDLDWPWFRPDDPNDVPYVGVFYTASDFPRPAPFVARTRKEAS